MLLLLLLTSEICANTIINLLSMGCLWYGIIYWFVGKIHRIGKIDGICIDSHANNTRLMAGKNVLHSYWMGVKRKINAWKMCVPPQGDTNVLFFFNCSFYFSQEVFFYKAHLSWIFVEISVEFNCKNKNVNANKCTKQIFSYNNMHWTRQLPRNYYLISPKNLVFLVWNFI